MRFLHVDIENFASIGKASFDLSAQGLVVVTGQNKDAESASSNGSGKSTLVVDSICWVLFGKTTKGGSADSITPGGSGKGTRVVLQFESGGKLYEVARNRKHPKHASKTQITENSQDITKATVADSDKLLAQILGITFETFLYTTILGQGMMFRFSQLTDQARKEILEGIAASVVYEDARVLARGSVQLYERELLVSRANLNAVDVQIGSLTKQLESTKQMQRDADAKHQLNVQSFQKSVVDAEAEIASLNHALQTAVAPVKTVSQDLYANLTRVQGAALTKVFDAGSKVTELETKVKLVNESTNRLKKVGPVCSNCGSAMTADHLQTELTKKAEELQTLNDALQVALAERDRASTMHQRLDTELGDLQRKEREENGLIQQYANWVSGTKARIESLSKHVDSIKQRIGSLVPDDYSSHIQSQQSQLATLLAKKESDASTIKHQEDCKATAEFWVTGFQEIRVHALDTLLVFLNSRLAHYSDVIMGKDISVSLSHNDKGKIDLNVTSAGSSYLSASGGEKDRIDICVAFALLDLARQCTNWSSNILVLDEIATFVDSAGVDRIMKAVLELMDQVESAFMISHNPVFEGYGDKVWTVVKENGVSRLEQ